MANGEFERSQLAGWMATGIASFLLAAVIMLAYMSQRSGDKWRPEWGDETHPKLGWIMGLTKLQFPMGARLLDSKHIPAYQGGTVWAKIAIARIDAPRFIRSIPKWFAKSEHSRLDVTRASCCGDSRAPVWWNPDSSHKFAAASYVDLNHTYKILVDIDDPGEAFIYVFWQVT